MKAYVFQSDLLLTKDGALYMRDALIDGDGDPGILTQWAERYRHSWGAVYLDSWCEAYLARESESYGFIRAEIQFSKSGDSWGDAMAARFAVAAELYGRGASLPESWRFRPGACSGSGIDPEDYLAPLCRMTSTLALTRIGNVLQRLTSRLEAQGKSY